MRSTKLKLIAIMVIPIAMSLPMAAQAPAKHHHYKLVDIGTFPGPSVYNRRITSNGSTPTEFEQVLNNQGTLVGGADTSAVNLNPNCFNPFNQNVECYVQHAFSWQGGRLTDLGTLSDGSVNSSFAYYISDNGLITGGSENGASDPNVGTPEFHATLWSNGAMTDLGTFGGSSSLGAGVNNAGQVIGFAQNTTADSYSIAGLGTQTRAFLWQGGKLHDLSTLGGPDAFATYINNNGQVVGVSYTSNIPDPNTGVPPLDIFLWEQGKGMKDIGNFGGGNSGVNGFNSSGEMTGFMNLAGDQIFHGFFWDGENLSDLNGWKGALGGNYSTGQALNNAGAMVGWASPQGDQVIHAVLWNNGTTTDLGTLNGDPCSEAEGINSSGQIVGASQSLAGGCDLYTTAFLWENGGPAVDLNQLISPPSLMWLVGATSINDQGEITGRGAPNGCGLADTCGHAYKLIPCDQNHPGIEGCDYSLVDASDLPQTTPPSSLYGSSALGRDNPELSGGFNPASLINHHRPSRNRALAQPAVSTSKTSEAAASTAGAAAASE